MKKQFSITSYYFILIVSVLLVGLFTIFQGSKHIISGTSVAELQLQKKQLIQEKQRLINKISENKSIAYISQQQTTKKFINISNPITIIANNEVASR